MTAIIGAGLSGLIAATQFPQARVFESSGSDSIAHRAVLRFRSDKLSRLLGIPFTCVTVRKSIYSAGRHVAPTIELANRYSRKTNGGYLDRSIWNVEPVERYIAPETLQQQLVEMVGGRLEWNAPIYAEDIGAEPLISTIPMSAMHRMLAPQMNPKLPMTDAMFRFASICVDRFRVAKANVYQTIYYPDAHTAVYRASMTGSLLIIERMTDAAEIDKLYDVTACDLVTVLNSFGLYNSDVTVLDLNHEQRFGKIAPIDDALRRQFIYQASTQHNVYSLGRFATWRNILLDDVIDDIAIIKRMIQQGHYGSTLQHLKTTKELT